MKVVGHETKLETVAVYSCHFWDRYNEWSRKTLSRQSAKPVDSNQRYGRAAWCYPRGKRQKGRAAYASRRWDSLSGTYDFTPSWRIESCFARSGRYIGRPC